MPVHTPAATTKQLADIFGGLFDKDVKARNLATKQGDALAAQNRVLGMKAMQEHLRTNPDDYDGAILAARDAVSKIKQTQATTGAINQRTEFEGQDQRKAQSVPTTLGTGFGAAQLPSVWSNELGNRRETFNENNLTTQSILSLMATGAIDKKDMPKYYEALVQNNPRGAVQQLMAAKNMVASQGMAEDAATKLRDQFSQSADPAVRKAMMDKTAKAYFDQTGKDFYQQLNSSNNLGLLRDLNKVDPRVIMPTGPDGKPVIVPEGPSKEPGAWRKAAQQYGDMLGAAAQRGMSNVGDAVTTGVKGVWDQVTNPFGKSGTKPTTPTPTPEQRGIPAGGKRPVPTKPDVSFNDTPLPKNPGIPTDEPSLPPGSRMADLVAEAQKPDMGNETDINAMTNALTQAGVDPATMAAAPTEDNTDYTKMTPGQRETTATAQVNAVSPGTTGPTPVQAQQMAQILGLSQPNSIIPTNTASPTVAAASKDDSLPVGGPDLKPLPDMNNDMIKNSIAQQGVQAQTLGPMLAQIISQLQLGGRKT
jgi:hypothetical protein